MMTTSRIEIRDRLSQETLYSFKSSEADQAYQKIILLQEMGVDVEIFAPNITTELAYALGLSGDELKDFDESCCHEIEDHEDHSLE